MFVCGRWTDLDVVNESVVDMGSLGLEEATARAQLMEEEQLLILQHIQILLPISSVEKFEAQQDTDISIFIC